LEHKDLTLVYEISHNQQAEQRPEFGEGLGARATPRGRAALFGTHWQDTGHPVLIPGSNRDPSFILMPEAGAAKNAYSVNHGAGQRMSRGEAKTKLDQCKWTSKIAALVSK